MKPGDKELQETREWAAKHYGIKPEEVVNHRSGICYGKIWVTTQEAADKVTEAVRHRTVNGGWFHGMPLGAQHKYQDMIEVWV